MTLTGSSLIRHVALPDHGVGLDGWFGGVTKVVSEHGFVHASGTHDLIGFKYLSSQKESQKALRNRSCPAIGFIVFGIRIEIAESRTARLLGMKTLKWREFEAKPKSEAKEERQIQRTGLWYGLDRWEETRLRWGMTSSVFGEKEIKKDLRNLDKFVSWGIRVLWQSNNNTELFTSLQIIMIVLCGLLVNPRSTVAAIVVLSVSVFFEICHIKFCQDVANQRKTAKLTATVIVVFVVTTAITKTHGEWFSPRRRRISPVNSDDALDFELFEIKNCPQTVACGVLRAF
uniref:Uncharacterized protein n=3 Tax=Brassica TaxID=3705 RepID=A0A0D3DJR7_BRAOL